MSENLCVFANLCELCAKSVSVRPTLAKIRNNKTIVLQVIELPRTLT
jgi:hypothetical protein